MKLKHHTKLGIGLAILAMATASANAATLLGTQIALGQNPEANAIRISFFDFQNGGAQYQAPGASGDGISGTIGSGTLLEYRYYSNNANSRVFVERGSGGSGFLSAATPFPGSEASFNSNEFNYWTTTDPDPGFSTTPDFTQTTGVSSVAGAGRINGTVDISNLLSGNLHILYGTNAGTSTLAFIMSGAGQDDVTFTISNPLVGSGNPTYWLANLAFDNSDGLYDTISYQADVGSLTGSNRNRGRFGFVAVEGNVIPEPTTALLGGLGMLFLLRRRRD